MIRDRPLPGCFTRLGWLLVLLLPGLAPGQDAEQRLALTRDSTVILAFSPALVAAAREHNALGLSDEQIRERHRDWVADPAPTPFKLDLQRNRAAALLRHHVTVHDHLLSAMLTDEQGALVASYPMADGYWLAGQPAWREVFGSRDHAVVELDSAATGLYQIGAPVYDAGRRIGVLLFLTTLPGSGAVARE